MEKFRNCPICFEVPEKEIYQCAAGHMICSSCIGKVYGGRCPQCRIPFGNLKIRNRILEEILDSLEFPCKFSEEGCTHLGKRCDVTSHANSCSFNPDAVFLCKQLGFPNCKFALGCVSRAEVISHFESHHGCPFKIIPLEAAVLPNTRNSRRSISCVFNLEGNVLMELLTRKRKSKDPNLSDKTITLISFGSSETAPLFLFLGKINRSLGSVYFATIKVWDMTSPPSKYRLLVTLNRATSNASSSSTTNEVNPFPLSWRMKVYSLKEAIQALKWIPVSVSVALLKETQFGANAEDNLQVKINT